MLDHIHAREKRARLTHEILAGFEPHTNRMRTVGIELMHTCRKLCAKLLDVCCDIVGLVRHLEAATKVNECDIRERLCDIEEEISPLQEHIGIENVATGVHVESVHVNAVRCNNTKHVTHLMNRDAELRINMSRADALVTTRHDMRVNAQTHRHTSAVLMAELFKYRDRVDVDVHAIGNSLAHFIKRHHVGRVENFVGCEASMQAKLDFLNRHRVESSAELLH